MSIVHRFFSVLAGIAWALGILGLIALVFLVMAVVADVFMRYVFNSPILGVRDMMSLFVVVTISAMTPLLMMVEGNITVNFIDYIKGRHLQKIIRVFANGASIVILAILAWRLWVYAQYLEYNNEVTIILLAPVAPWWKASAVLLIYAAFMGFYAIYRNLCLTEHRVETAGGEA